MSKKYLIIMIAACIVCLGTGVFIGTGFKENNLAATGASQAVASEDLNALPEAANEDFAAMEPADLQIALKDYSDRLRVMEKRQEAAKKVIAELNEVSYLDCWVITDGLYKNVSFLGDARNDETFENRYMRCFGYLRDFPFEPGTSLPCEYSGLFKEEVEYALDYFDEAAADYQTAIDNIKKALSDIKA